MSYLKALEAAGVEVIDYKYFGSYQGDLIVRVMEDGKEGFVSIAYGSCSGCDSYEAKFGWREDGDPDFQEKLAAFGRAYLPSEAGETIIARFEKNLDWDDEAHAIVEWVKERL